MDREQILAMDSYILLSIINTKLRDEFNTIEDLCYDYSISVDEIVEKLNIIGYVYNRTSNQFIHANS